MAKAGFDRRKFLILFVLLVFLGTLSTLYFFLQRAEDISPTYITNSLLLYFLGITNFLLLVVIIFVLSRYLVKLLLERWRNVSGSRFRTKLVTAFIGLILVPSALLFWAASDLIVKSVESWFNPPVEQVLDNSLRIAESYYQDRQREASRFAEELAQKIEARGLASDLSQASLQAFITQKGAEYGLDTVSVYGINERAMVVYVGDSQSVSYNPIDPDEIRQGLQGEKFWRIDSHGVGQIVRSGVPFYRGTEREQVAGVVVAGYFLSGEVSSLANMVRHHYEEYEQLKLQKQKIQKTWVSIYLTISLLIIFSAVWIGLYLARGITDPIQKLAEGTEAVSAGELDHRVEVEATDELRMLVDSFNRMTEALQLSKKEIDASNRTLRRTNQQLRERRRYIETVLETIPTGVFSLNADGVITTANRSAAQILRLEKPALLNAHYREALAAEDRREIRAFIDRYHEKPDLSVDRRIVLHIDSWTINLAVNFTTLADEFGDYAGMIVVLEDLSELMKAQRIATWREVAKQVAHEIKNPLTPIQLSAERMYKHVTGVSEDFQGIAAECRDTIIKEVDSLKTLVDEFSRFARLPTVKPLPGEINEVVEATIQRYESTHGNITIRKSLQPDMPEARYDPEQLKRVLINLIENAIEAMAGEGEIHIKTQYDTHLQAHLIEIIDHGTGIDQRKRDKLFVPSFSTKKDGSGLGLAIVSRIISDHNGFIRVDEPESHQGTKFVLGIPA